MNKKIPNRNKDIGISIETDSDGVTVHVDFQSNKFFGLDAQFKIFAQVDVHDSEGVNGSKTLYSQKFSIRENSKVFKIPQGSLSGFTYNGQMIDINLAYQLKIDDGVFIDTKFNGNISRQLVTKPEIRSDAKELINPKDVFKFLKNLAAIPFHNKIITLGLCVVGLVVMAVNTLIGVHDQFVHDSGTYLYSHVDSDGEGQSPFINSLLLSGAAGAMVWFAMKSQLKKYMVFKLRQPSGPISRSSQFQVSQLVKGYSRVDLKDVALRVVACNLEKGQYMRGSGSNRRTVSFSEPIQGVLLFEKRVDLIKKHVPVENAFPEKFKFKPMFDALYPPNMISRTHGIDVYWEIQLIHNEFVDQELKGPVDGLKNEDFFKARQ